MHPQLPVVHRQLEEIQTVIFSKHTANVQIYTEDACIFIIDREGRWHTKGFDYTITRLLKGSDMFSMCRRIAPDSPGFLAVFLYRSTEIKGYHTGEDPRLFRHAGVRGCKRRLQAAAKKRNPGVLL